ncbi:MAG: DUF192 domain-containing protein [Bdellovibrionota bacterium]
MVWLCNFLSILVLSTSFAAEIKFKRIPLVVGTKHIEVELAESPEQHAHGLMYRKSLPKDQGMLFVFDRDDQRSFWMKNTFVNLSIGYFDSEKKLVDIQEMKASESVMNSSTLTYPSAKPAMYALEMPQGWFKKNKIKLGQRFRFP